MLLRSKIPTPNLDKLCRNGVELDAHYVAPMCTPTEPLYLQVATGVVLETRLRKMSKFTIWHSYHSLCVSR